jgi:NAD(P)-dependent dehydrogenase (short-subunit alcohol dehydrogenase family)
VKIMGDWAVDVPYERVLITGGGSGIGRGVALQLASLGKTVYVMGRRQEALDETVSLGRELPGTLTACAGDATDPDAVDAVFSTVEQDGPATALVHAAAQVSLGPAMRISPAEFRQTIDNTLCAAFNVLQRWAKPLLDGGTAGAAVMMTSSTATGGAPGISHSSAGKAGVTSLVRAVGREWGPAGLRVNCVGPGAFPIAKSEAMFGNQVVQDRMNEMIALQRYGQLPEIVGPIMFFLSSASMYTTGQSLVVDGGQTLVPWLIPREALEAGLNNQYPS